MVTVSLVVFLSASPLFSQSGAPNKSPEFDHIAIHVRDLGKSVEFYEKVMGLEKIPEPFKDGRHIWVRMGAHSQLHIVGGASGNNWDNTQIFREGTTSVVPQKPENECGFSG